MSKFGYNYPGDMQAYVDVSVEDIVEFVRDNASYFRDELGYSDDTVNEVTNWITTIIDKFDYVRRYRDSSSDIREQHKSEIDMYESMLAIRDEVRGLKHD